MKSYEVNFDGIVGPTHNYSGLSLGNVASTSNIQQTSNPKEAALQGLEKMWFLHELGVKQAVLPPHERPHVPTLKKLGYEFIKDVPQKLLYQCSSASAMWTANAATCTPSIDNESGRLQITPANLQTMFHRSIEPAATRNILLSIFSDHVFFNIHEPLPSHARYSDEGAANHTRLCKDHSHPGIHLYVYGSTPKKYPARQRHVASEAIARSHRLLHDHAIFAAQNPAAIDAGVFHNDVISVGNENLFLYHEEAFEDDVINMLREKMEKTAETELHSIKVSKEQLSLEEAVATYLFNSQILSLPNGSMTLIAPTECSENPKVKEIIEDIISRPYLPLGSVHFLDVRQSMRNGGGPACLRLRIVLNENELKAIKANVMLTQSLYLELRHWIEKHYRDRLAPKDLADPDLYKENCHALLELTKILNLGPIYSFQKDARATIF